MKKIIIAGMISVVLMANAKAVELIHINHETFDQLQSLEYESYDSGYAIWQAGDIELFLSENENFSVGVWKAKVGEEFMDTPYPYNTLMLIQKGQIETVDSSGDKSVYKAGEGFMTPKGWTGTFSITKDLEIIYIYDGFVATENDPSIDLNNIAKNNYNKNAISMALSRKQFEREDEQSLLAKEELTFTNKDESFQIGTWSASAGSVPAKWPYDEFMYVLKGSIEMTDANGKVLVINPNEGVVVPKDWEGVFSVLETVVKIWVIYDN